MAAAADTYSREFSFDDRQFERLRALVASFTGICLSDAKRDMTYGRIARRLRALGMTDFDQYCDLIERGDDTELEHFVNAITTNLTSFFRERHHFEYLAESVLPEVLERNRAERRLRIWSAGCSTGEEPYSIAMTALDSCPRMSGWVARILATDLDSDVLERASNGIYASDRVTGIDRARQSRWFQRGADQRVRVVPEVRDLIRFRRPNLMEPWPMRGPFDVILCRNVVIYFDKETQRRLFDRYAEILAPAGVLFVAPSECPSRVPVRIDVIGQTPYRRRG